MLIGTSDKFYDLIYIGGWVYTIGLVYLLLRHKELFHPIVRKILFFIASINLLTMFPFYRITLDTLETISFPSLLKENFIRAISLPLFSFSTYYSILQLVKRGLSIRLGFKFFAVYFFLSIGIFLSLQGTPYPRLEDEFAYYFQSLIFDKGKILFTMQKPPEISWERFGEITQLPYIFFQKGVVYSAHFHGTSFLLSLFGLFKLKPFTGIILLGISFFLYYSICQNLFYRNTTARWIALLLFIGSPLLITLSATYMSHIPALFSILVIISSRIWIAKREREKKSIIVPTAFLGLGFFLSIWIRPQSAFPSILALLLFEGYNIILKKFQKKERIYLFFSYILFFIISYGSIKWYSSQLPAKNVFLTSSFMNEFFAEGCQSIGLGQNTGCFDTYRTLGHSPTKLLFNLIDLSSTLSAEHSPIALPLLPLFLLLLPIGFQRMKKGKIDLLLFGIFSLNFGVFALYWHNGGESYKGRYLADSIFSFYLLLGLWGSIFIKRKVLHIVEKKQFLASIVIFFIIGSIYSILFGIRGHYLNREHVPYSSLDKFTNEYPKNAIIASSNTQRDHFQEFSNRYKFLRENDHSKIVQFTKRQVLSFFNLGNVTLAAVSTHMDDNGYLRDKFGNVLFTEIHPSEFGYFQKWTQTNSCYTIQDFESFTPRKDKKKLITFWASEIGEFKPCDLNSP
jgi:hypothetical protein